MKLKYLGAAFAAVVFSFGLSTGELSTAQAADKDYIDYRQNLMKSLGAHASALGAIAQNKVTHSDNLALHADAIAAASEAAVLAFKNEIPGEGKGKAGANIWEDWEDFEGRFMALAASARDVAAAARSGGMAEAGPKMGGLFTCKSCHDIYRIQ